jgi:trans-aconitate methyltransferase
VCEEEDEPAAAIEEFLTALQSEREIQGLKTPAQAGMIPSSYISQMAEILPQEGIDGIFANATLHHVPSRELPHVLQRLARALRPNGLLFVCSPRGDDEEGWLDERYICLLSLATWSRLARAAGFRKISHCYRPPGLPRKDQDWLASLWRRI